MTNVRAVRADITLLLIKYCDLRRLGRVNSLPNDQSR